MHRLVLTSGAIAASLVHATAAAAQEVRAAEDDWHFRAASYVFMSDINGEQNFPAPQGIHVDFSDLVKKTQFSFMGAFEARYRRVGGFADVIFIDLGDKKNDTTRLGQGPGGGVPLPPGITADLKLDVKSWIVTVAGFYQVHQGPDSNVDLFAGGRMTKTKTELDYAFSAPFGPFIGPAQQGRLGGTTRDWDAIAGTKGRVNFGAKREWFLLGYADVGTGASKLTWQSFVGGGRRFGRFEMLTGYRYLTFEYDSDSPVEELTYSGPLIGASLSF